MDTNNHPLIGKRIEDTNVAGSGGIVAHISADSEGDVFALIITDTGEISTARFWLGGWCIVTPDPAAEPPTKAPQPDADGWIPLDGTRFPDVEPDTRIIAKFRGGTTKRHRADSLFYRHDGATNDIIAWRRA